MNLTRTIPLALVERAGAGDELAFRRLERAMSGKIWSLARGYFAPGLDADDLYQEGLLGLHSAVRDFNAATGPCFESFAYHCAKRAIISAVRTATRRKGEPLNEAAGGELGMGELFAAPVARGVGVQRQCEARIYLGLILAQAQSRLSPLERAALGRDLAGWGPTESSNLLGVSVKSVENATRRARQKLTSALEEIGWRPSFPAVAEDRGREARMAPKRDAVAAVLRGTVEALTLQEIAEAIDRPVQGLHKLLERMEARGEARRTNERWLVATPDLTANWPAGWRVSAGDAA